MPDLTEEQARKDLGFGPATPVATEALAPQFTPQLSEAEARRQLGIPATGMAKPQTTDFATRNFQGIPIDENLDVEPSVLTEAGFNAPIGRGVAMRENQQDKVRFLEQYKRPGSESPLFGPGNVRLADDGTPLVTIWDAKRQSPVEVPVRPGVVGTIQAVAPETAGALLGMKAGSKVPTSSRFLKFAAEMIGGALGQETGTGIKQAAVSSTPLDEIIKERVSAIPTTATETAALGAVGAVAGKVLPIISPFGGNKGVVETGMEDAVDYFAKKYGVQYPLSPGEQIASPIFKRVEATMAPQPGASARFKQIQREKVDALRQIQNKMLASGINAQDVGMLRKLEEDVGEDAIAAIKQKINPLQRAEELASNAAAQQAHNDIMDELSKAAGPARQLYPERVGGSLRAGAVSRVNAWEAKSRQLYEDLYQIPGGKDKVLEPPNLVADAKKLLAEQPSPEIITTTPSPIVGPSGQPIMVTTTGTEPLREFVPEGVMPMLNRLTTLKHAKFSLQDLVKMRTEVRDSIKRGQAVADVSTHYLDEIHDLLTRAINESADALPTSDLKTAWKAANDFYAKGGPGYIKGVGAAKDKNIARMFRDNQTGLVQDEDLVRNIGPTEYNSYKEFYGANSTEMTALKRMMLDQLVPQGDLIDAKQFLGNLRRFVDKNRSVAEDIMGTAQTQRIEKIGGVLEMVQGGQIDRADAIQLLSGTGKTGLTAQINDLATKQAKLTELYKSQIVKDIAEGKLGETFNATEFVDRLWDNASPKEIKAVKELLKDRPEILDDLERKVGERIFFKAQRQAAGIEPSRMEPGQPFKRSSASSVERIFGEEQNKARLNELLGPERTKDFEQLAKLLTGSESTEIAFAGAGGFSAQMQIHRMLSGGALSYLPGYLWQKAASIIYFSKPLQKLVMNQVGRSPFSQSLLARSIVASKPFTDAITSDYGPEQAGLVIDRIIDSIDLYDQQGPKGRKALEQQDWIGRVMGQNPNAPKVGPTPRKRSFKLEE